MTPADIKSYKNLEREIYRAEKKLDILRENDGIADITRGSFAEYPYTAKSFRISAPTNSQKIKQQQKEVDHLKMLKRQIEETVFELMDYTDRIIFTESMSGKSQKQISMMLNIDQTSVSRRLRRICDTFS